MARGRKGRVGRRRGARVPRGLVVAVVVVLLGAAAVVAAKVLADRAAQSQVDSRVTELHALLDEAGPSDFLAFNAGDPDVGVAEDTAGQADFVSVNAEADRAVIRFQPEGWWEGFTERCIVAVVTDDAVEVVGTKTACVRTDPATFRVGGP